MRRVGRALACAALLRGCTACSPRELRMVKLAFLQGNCSECEAAIDDCRHRHSWQTVYQFKHLRERLEHLSQTMAA